jgi:hypothetical protein
LFVAFSQPLKLWVHSDSIAGGCEYDLYDLDGRMPGCHFCGLCFCGRKGSIDRQIIIIRQTSAPRTQNETKRLLDSWRSLRKTPFRLFCWCSVSSIQQRFGGGPIGTQSPLITPITHTNAKRCAIGSSRELFSFHILQFCQIANLMRIIVIITRK